MTALHAPIPELYVSHDSAQKLKVEAAGLLSHDLTARQTCDLELLMNGAFYPLRGFLPQDDYTSVVDTMRLASGALWPMPVTLDVTEAFAAKVEVGQDIALRDQEGVILATMTVTDKWVPNKAHEAEMVFGADDSAHPAVHYLHNKAGKVYLGGPVTGLQPPVHYDFKGRRDTPNELRAYFRKMGWQRIVAFQTRNPLHRAHQELTFRAARGAQANLLIHPVVGMTKPGDVDHFTRVRCYEAVLDKYPSSTTHLSLLNLAMRMGGPREALWHAIIRRNFGANYLIVGRDHAGPGNDSTGRPFYGPYDAQELVQQHSAEVGVGVLTFSEMVYLPDEQRYEESTRIPDGAQVASISGTQVRSDYLNRGRQLPDWFTRPEVADILSESYPPRHRQGVCLWFTGLSGAGKSTTAEVLTILLLEHGRQVTVLDGDVVRTHLSKGLGFSKEDRDVNIRRIGFVAAELVRHGGIAVCAAVSPYRATREDVRAMVGKDRFVEIFVDTPIEVCEDRDVKGMYAKARRGEITGFTGIDDPYEAPVNPEIALDTVAYTPEENAQRIVAYLLGHGYVRGGE